MRLLLPLILPLAALARESSLSFPSTFSFSLHVSPSAALPHPAALPPSTHATLSTLSAPPHSAYITPTGAFVFANVTPGSYLVDVHCATHAFAPLRVDVDGVGEGGGEAAGELGAWDTFRGNDWDNRGAPRRRLSAEMGSGSAFEIQALAGKNFFIERPRFSLLSILKNPMILIALFGGVMFMVMPYLMENMDPEMRAEFEATQKTNPMSALLGGGGGGGAGGFDMAEYLSGAGAAKNAGCGNGQKGGKNKAKK